MDFSFDCFKPSGTPIPKWPMHKRPPLNAMHKCSCSMISSAVKIQLDFFFSPSVPFYLNKIKLLKIVCHWFLFHILKDWSSQSSTPQNGYHMMDNDINMLLQHLDYCKQSDTDLSLTKWRVSPLLTHNDTVRVFFLNYLKNAQPEPANWNSECFMLNNFISLLDFKTYSRFWIRASHSLLLGSTISENSNCMSNLSNCQ